MKNDQTSGAYDYVSFQDASDKPHLVEGPGWDVYFDGYRRYKDQAPPTSKTGELASLQSFLGALEGDF